MKVMLLGAGAVGAPLCTRLTKASELYLIMDDKRAEEYKGIIVNGLHYQIPLAKKGDKADLIILACNYIYLLYILFHKPLFGTFQLHILSLHYCS